MSHISFNVANSRPLIPRQQTYLLERKLVSIHSEDRDIKKYPKSNKFSITLPCPLENVQSIRMVECTFPIAYYTFRKEYQNTKLSFSLTANNINMDYYSDMIGIPTNNQIITIEIQEGFYCPEDLAAEIQEKLNDGVTAWLGNNGITHTYEYLRCYYDKVGQRFWFGSIHDIFTLYFDKQEEYDLDCGQPNMWDKQTNWGLGWYLGFHKKTIIAKPSIDSVGNAAEIKFSYLGPAGVWLTPTSSSLPIYYCYAHCAPRLLGDRTIYMELNKYNSIDELVPNPTNTNSMYNNTWNAIVNSAFAKIPITDAPLGEFNDSRNGFLQNITHMDIPEEKIVKLDLLFRYHDGRLVEFCDAPFNFTLEFNCLKNEIARAYDVRVPITYTL